MTMTHIQTVKLSSNQASIEITSIPDNFDDLILYHSTRTTTSASNDGLVLVFNQDTNNNYLFREFRAENGGFSSSTGSRNHINSIGNGNGSPSNTFATARIYIFRYASSQNKIISVDTGSIDDSTTVNHRFTSAEWFNSSKITSLNLSCDQESFVAGSTLSLYGITSGSDGTTTVS